MVFHSRPHFSGSIILVVNSNAPPQGSKGFTGIPPDLFFRVTEDNIDRVTEDGIIRVTEDAP